MILFNFFPTDECARALVSFKHATEFELPIRSHHGIRIDLQINGELADGRKLISSGQRAGSNTSPYLIDELTINGDAGMEIEAELKSGLVIPGHAINVL